MRGRPRWPRLIPALIVLAGTIGLYGTFFRTAPRVIWPTSWPAWWSRSLDEVAEANSKYKWLIRHSRVLSRLTEMNLKGGSSRALWTGDRAETDHINGLFLSQDGRRLTVWHSGFIETRRMPSGSRERRIDDDDQLLAFAINTASVIEVDRDGRIAIVVGPAPEYIAQAIDLTAGTALWRIDHLADGDRDNLRVLHAGELNRFIVAGEFPGSGETELAEWYVHEQHGPSRMRQFATEAHALGPRLARNGFGKLIWASNFDQVEAWSLQTERVERRIDLPARSVLVAAWPNDLPRLIITMFDQDSKTWIVDVDAGRVLAEVAEAPLRTRSTEVLADGRTLAVWGFDKDLTRKVLHLYDLSPIIPVGTDSGG
jgi:hypothetical protein